jgi:multiple sugar transport system ATP-binding protein
VSADGATIALGSSRIGLSAQTFAEHPGLGRYEGRQVVVGIRPEDMEDAAVDRDSHPDCRLRVTCDIREDLGSEVYVHFTVAADPVATAEVVEALVVEHAEDEDAHLAAQPARGSGVTFVARLDRATVAREGEPLEIAVDVGRLHFFDPDTGATLPSRPS